jgi:hypothetical protein
MDALFETFPDDVEALKAALVTERLNAGTVGIFVCGRA